MDRFRPAGELISGRWRQEGWSTVGEEEGVGEVVTRFEGGVKRGHDDELDIYGKEEGTHD